MYVCMQQKLSSAYVLPLHKIQHNSFCIIVSLLPDSHRATDKSTPSFNRKAVGSFVQDMLKIRSGSENGGTGNTAIFGSQVV